MAHTEKRLRDDFFLRSDTVKVARDLLGTLLVVPTPDGQCVSGMIAETEAYMGIEDKAAHSYGGRRTARNERADPYPACCCTLTVAIINGFATGAGTT